MTDFSAPKYNRESSETDVKFRRVLLLSIALHILVLIGIPLMTKLFWKEKEFKRPQTFQLVQAPQPVPPAPRTPPPPEVSPPEPTPPEPPPPQPQPAPEPRPTPPTPVPKPEPKPTPAPQPTPPPRQQESKPQDDPKPPVAQETPPPPPKPVVEEDLSALEALFSNLPAPTQISAPGVQRSTVLDIYLNNVRVIVERNWQPATQDRNLEVIVKFTINNDGSISGLSVSKSSGQSALDNVALRAIERSRFPKFPPGISEDKLPIDFTLRPTTRR